MERLRRVEQLECSETVKKIIGVGRWSGARTWKVKSGVRV